MRWKSRYLRVFSRHPSVSPIRNSIVTPKGFYAVYRHGSVTPSRGADLEINTVEAVENSMNKLRMKQLFREAGVRSPEFFEINDSGVIYTNEETNITELPFPLIAKRTYRSRGVGMQRLENYEELSNFISRYIVNNRINVRNRYYLERYANYTKEYRLHISPNGCFYTCRKMLREDATNRWYRNDSNSVWILQSNEMFDQPETWDAIVADCQTAREAIGLTIGAFDVRVAGDGRHQIIEVNSAPSFGEVTTIAYQNELTNLIYDNINV